MNITGWAGSQPGRVHVGLSNGTSFAGWTWMSPGRMVDPYGTNLLGDVNGDGKADLVSLTERPMYGPVRLRVGLSDGGSFAGWTSTWTEPALTHDLDGKSLLGDVNGDRKADFISILGAPDWRPGHALVGLSKGDAFETWSWSGDARMTVDHSGSLVADVTGDGRADLVHVGGPPDEQPGRVRVGSSVDGPGRPVSTRAVHLRRVVACVAGDVCLPATTFKYQAPVTGFATDPPAGSSSRNISRSPTSSFWGDVNGDGRADFVYLEIGTSAWHVKLSDGTALGPDTFWGANAQAIKWDTGDHPRLQDVNADGRADIVYFQAGTEGTWRALLSTGTSFVDTAWATTTSGIDSYGGSHQFFLVDLTGDAKTDLVYQQSGTTVWRAALSSAGSTTLGPDSAFGAQGYGAVSLGGYHGHFWGDVNGDAKADLVYQKDNSSSWRVLLSTGTVLGPDTEWAASVGARWDAGDGPRLVDVNADGMSDLVYRRAEAVWMVRPSTGASFGAESTWMTTTSTIAQDGGRLEFFPTDVDGDGRADMVYRQDGTATWRAALSSRGSANGLGPDDVFGNHAGSASPDGYHFSSWADVDGDGKSDLVRLTMTDGVSTFRFGRSSPTAPDLLSTVTNGLGATITLTYRPLTDPGTYTRESEAAYPYQDVQNATPVVSRIARSDGVGGQYGVSYHYTGARAHLTGPGWVGFREVQSTDERTNIATTTTYSQDYESRLNGLATRVESRHGTVVVKRTATGWSGVDLGGGRRFARTDSTQEQTADLDGSPVNCVKTENAYSSFDAAGDYGNYGLPSTVTTRTTANCATLTAFVKTTTVEYAHDTTRNILGMPTRTQVTYRAPGAADVTRTASTTYTASGQPASETIEPHSPTLWSTTSYSYDAFGNRTSSTVRGPDITDRTTRTGYDAQGRYPVSTTNALGHTTPVTVDPRWGAPLTRTDANGLTTTYEYDDFGRTTRQTRPDNTSTTTTYAGCDACAPMGNGVVPAYVVTTRTTGGRVTSEYHDALNRTVRVEGRSLTGAAVYQDTWYDAQGRPRQRSNPYFAVGETPAWTAYGYDDLGRPTSATDPAGKLTTNGYAGLTTTETISGPGITTRSRTTVRDALGKDVSVTDSQYPTRSTTYAYDATGNLVTLADLLGNQTTFAYDLRGRKTHMTDPDTGSWTYEYNSAGELVSQTDATGQTQTVTYDALGRIRTRTTGEGTTEWTYDTAPKGVGQLAGVSSPGGFSETYSYDTQGRPARTTTTIDGQRFTVSIDYDSAGRPDTLTYPTGFATRNVYGPNGELVEIRNKQTNALYWQANEADARGHPTRETLGNGLVTTKAYDPATGTLDSIRTTDGSDATRQDLTYTFDILGNLLTRTDNTRNASERFQYDTLNRLTAVTGPSNRTYQYDETGNITYKSDVGTYTYPASGAGAARPHAVTQVSGALDATYTYDANGNMTSGAGRTITYTSFNKPSQITTDATTVSFAYDANQNRIRKTTGSSTTLYIGKLYERVMTGDLVEHRHYIGGVGVYTYRSDGTSGTRYLLTDHLGSTGTIADQNGAVVQELSYDAHGKPRNSNWTDATDPITAQAARGFTGHEMDDEAGLINMNAREYDPVLGRFLQPDTIVQAPYGQGLNRYTYANNNPLSYTDPSGNFSLKKIIRAVVVAVVTFYCAVCGAALQAALVKHDGGTWSQALRAGAISFASSYAMQNVGNNYTGLKNVVANGVIGGTASKLAGGDFKSGFLGAAAGAAAAPFVRGLDVDPYARGLVGGLAGGSAARLGGGDFGSGFAGGAVSYYLGSGMDSDRARSTGTYSGSLGLWVEGNTPGRETGLHLSLGVGNLNGYSETYSFGLPTRNYSLGDLLAGPGEVYLDPIRGGQIREFYPVTFRQAEAIQGQLAALRGTVGAYNLLVNQCRSFTYRELNSIVQQYDLRRAQ